MISKEIIRQIIIKVIDEIIPDKNIKSLDESFISENSNIESIEVAQIIVRVEELIQENGVDGYDLFENLFEQKFLTFNSLIELIYKDLM
tara:strand:+ start:201 stop:467 length:267 start_codon:yes stop_codon:yes gene_type:complete